ncbi:MAG: hypothetical protein SFY56_07915 [Bacteroidota bacterium]|nr:hypothetical protein [Bacteroidota bacterium]
MTRLLTEEEFKSTFTDKMVDVTATAEPLVDIWPYVQELAKDKIVDQYTFDKGLVEKVYRNQTGTFDQVLLPTSDKNTFIVILVDLNFENIKGHYKLDLKREYGLTEQEENVKLLPNVMFRLFKELWFASSDCSHPIENIGIRLLEVAKSTNNTKDYVREYLNELIKQGHIEMTSEKPLLFTITNKGKKVKTIEDVEQLCAAANL